MDEYLWVRRTGEDSAPVGAQRLHFFKNTILVLDDNEEKRWVTSEDILGPMHPSCVSGVDDMIALGDLQEYSILRNLQIRYAKNIVYTYIGNILVAINPYKFLNIYEETNMCEYQNKRIGQLPPHIFAVAEYSFQDMLNNSKERCIIISGESGAGKTENAKYFLKYLAHVSYKKSVKGKQILDSNPLLEAFGNAKTESNDNSSRFGKYIIVCFDSCGSISGARIMHYLLEKSRVVSQSGNERNYHIFYALLNGLSVEEKLRLGLNQSNTYKYLNAIENQCSDEVALRKRENIETIKNTMNTLSFSESEIWGTFELIAAILHVGQIQYKEETEGKADYVEISSQSELTFLSKLLAVDKDELRDCLTKKKLGVEGDTVTQVLTKQQAENARDAFAKRIYLNLFNFLVNRINEILGRDERMSERYIGILDIYGFETFEKNAFEQFCINYANEKLQQFFIGHVFKAEQKLYEIEGIDWEKIEYTDNTDVLELIEKGPNSILSIINDESKFPIGTNDSVLNRLIQSHSENSNFFKPKYGHVKAFALKHYADVVAYDVKDFVEKNQDACSLSIKNIIRRSKNEFLTMIFAQDLDSDSTAFTKRTETLLSKFKSSLDSLMNELSKCEPFFVRCLKPNTLKKPNFFDREVCRKQLKYSGMAETTKIREAGYAVRYDYFDFVNKYAVVCPEIFTSFRADPNEKAMRICTYAFPSWDNRNFRFGKTKIFLKYSAETQLEDKRDEALNFHAVNIQKVVKGWLQRKRWKKLREKVENIEDKRPKKSTNEESNKVSEKEKREREYLRYLITRFQAWCRGYLARKLFKRKVEKKELVQASKALKEKNESDCFEMFARKYFQSNQTILFSRKPIKSPLLQGTNDSVSVPPILWMTILRFLGNVKEPKKRNNKVLDKPQARSVLSEIKRIVTGHGQVDNKILDKLYSNWLSCPSTDLEKVEFIVFHALQRSELADEIYCQIYKALNKNPSRKAVDKGWKLLGFCTGCFPPSDLLLPYFRGFLQAGPKAHSNYCLFRLHRTIKNGKRTQPPGQTEFNAILKQKPIEVEVYLSNGSILSIKIDSATTAKEMLDLVAKRANLIDIFGFSIVLGHDMKHLSLGDGSEFVMDVVAQCEHYALETGDNSKTLPWKLYLKKEMFAPWHDYRADEVSTGLICAQIADGVRAGEYECGEEMIGFLVAEICYVEHGKVSLQKLNKIIKECVPHYIYTFSPEQIEQVEEQVRSAYFEMFISNSPSVAVSGSLIKFAMNHWPLQFSKLFHVTGSLRNESISYSYPEVPLVIAVNSQGIIVIDENNEDRTIMTIHFNEIKDVLREEVAGNKGYNLLLTSYLGCVLNMIVSSTEETLYLLLLEIIENLKKLSKFVLATRDYKTSDSSFLSFEKGDLIILGDGYKGEHLMRNSWAEGLNERTGVTGNFISDCVRIIPTVNKPPNSLVHAMTHKNFSFNKNLLEKLKHYTLRNYAATHFARQYLDLNKFSLKRLDAPLHADLADDQLLSAKALLCYQAISHFFETDCVTFEEKIFQMTQQIFEPPLKNIKLRNEIYCQILYKLTSHSGTHQEEKGWELLWLATGLFSCYGLLAGEVKKFLLSRRTLQPARECLARFYSVQKSGPRVFAPHLIEIKALRHKPSQILYKINFPDESHKFFRLTSLTKVQHLKESIINRLKINSPKSFSLCVQVVGRLFVLLDDYYVFDYFHLLQEWVEKYKVPAPKWQYQLYFIKQNWKNDIPGNDKEVDLKFIYPQEYNKYMQGLYKEIPLEHITMLASLLCNHSMHKLSRHLLHTLIPRNMIEKKKEEVWVAEIKELSLSKKSLSEEERKIEFLKYLHKLPSYGLQHFAFSNHSSTSSSYMFYPVTKNTKLITL